MAKVVGPAVGTQFDPLAASQQELSKLGLVPTEHNTEFSLTSQTTGLNEFSNIDLSQYDNPPSLYSDDAQASSILNEMRAQNQGAGEQFLKGVGRVVSTAITEIFKVPGYIGGALGSSLMEGDFIENTVDNAWVNAFQSLDENIKESMPIYLTKEVEEGGIGRKLMSSAWWSTTGADGIGFLLSMYAPGKILGTLGSGLKLAQGVEAIANSSKLGAKLARYSTLVDNAVTFTEQGLKVTGKGVNKLESLATVATNTFVESAAEAANTFDNVKETYMRNNPNATEEEAKKVAGDQAASVMKANIAVLALSNYFDELTLFNGFGKGDAAIKNSVFGKLTKDGVIDFTDLSKIEKYGFRQWASKELPLKVAGAFAKEGLFEEGLQTKIQQHYEKKAAGETGKNFFDDVIGDYFHSLLSDPEMQESVVLGGILGGGAGVIGSYSDMKNTETFLRGGEAYSPNFFGKMLGRKPREATKGFLDLANENFIQSTRSLKDIAELDDQGNIKFETKQKQVTDPATGQVTMQDIQAPIINQDKLKNLMEEKSSMLQLVTLHSILSQAGEVEQAEVYKQLIDYARFTPFIQQEGGYEVLEAFIKSGKLTELEANQVLENENRNLTDAEKQDITNNMLKQAKLFKDTYDEVNRTFIPEKYVKPDDKEQYNAWKQTVFNRKLQNLLASKNLTQQMFNIKNKYGDFELTEDDFNTLTPDEALNKKRSKDVYDKLGKQWQDAKETYLKLSDANGLREDYEEFKQAKEKELEEVAKQVKDSTQQALDDATATDNFKQLLGSSGYEVTDTANGFQTTGLDNNFIVVSKPVNGVNKDIVLIPFDNNGVTDYMMINEDGQRVKVTNNGIFPKSFLEDAGVVLLDEAKETLKKAEIQRLKNEKLQTLELLQEFQKQNYREGKERLAKLDELLDKTYEEIVKYNNELNEAIDGVNARKAGTSTATSQTVDISVIEGLLDEVLKRYNALSNERQFLVTTLANITKLTIEYESIADNIRENPEYDLEKELKDIIKNIEEFKQNGKDLLDGINLINEQLEVLGKNIDSINFMLTTFKGFAGLMKVDSKNWKQIFQEISKIISDKNLLDNLSLIKDNINKNKATVNVYNMFDNFINKVYNLDPNLIPLFVNKLKEYELSDDELINSYGYGDEILNMLNNRILIKNNRVIELRQELNRILNTKFEDLKQYIALASTVSDKIFQLYYDAEHDLINNNIDKSQQALSTDNEVSIVPDVNDIFAQGNLPETMYSTTGIAVEYDSKGNDKITNEGFPELNNSIHQRNWFYTVDKLADTITEYQLKVVKAVWDSNDEIQRALQENNPNPANRGSNDLFVVLIDKNGNYVRIDDDNNIGDKGRPVFTSISRPERMFPKDSKAKVQTKYLLNFYLKSRGIDRVRYDSDLAGKSVDIPLSEIFNAKELTRLGLDVDDTLRDLLNEAIVLAEKTYKDQYEIYSKKQPILQIQGISKGYRLYQLDENGVKKKFKPLDSISEISLKPDNFTSGQLQGGRLAIATEASIKGPNNSRVKLPPGTVYLTLTNNEVIPLTQRKLNDNEAKVVMYLLAQSAGKSLKEFKVDVKNPDGSDFNYTIGINTLTSPFNVFYVKAFNAPSFSLLNTFIHYGLKPKGQSPNGQLYINSNKIYYTTFAGENKVLEISDLTKALTLDNPQEYNKDVQEFYDFLLSKNFNIDSSLLNNNGKFAYPTYTKNGLSFDTSQTYYSFLFDNVVTTTAAKKEGYPGRLQRNLSFGNQSSQNQNRSKKQAASTQTNPTAKQAPTPPVVPTQNQFDPAKTSIIDHIESIKNNIEQRRQEALKEALKVAETKIKTIDEQINKLQKERQKAKKADINSYDIKIKNLKEAKEKINKEITQINFTFDYELADLNIAFSSTKVKVNGKTGYIQVFPGRYELHTDDNRIIELTPDTIKSYEVITPQDEPEIQDFQKAIDSIQNLTSASVTIDNSNYTINYDSNGKVISLTNVDNNLNVLTDSNLLNAIETQLKVDQYSNTTSEEVDNVLTNLLKTNRALAEKLDSIFSYMNPQVAIAIEKLYNKYDENGNVVNDKVKFKKKQLLELNDWIVNSYITLSELLNDAKTEEDRQIIIGIINTIETINTLMTLKSNVKLTNEKPVKQSTSTEQAKASVNSQKPTRQVEQELIIQQTIAPDTVTIEPEVITLPVSSTNISDIERRRQEDRNRPSRESILYKLINKIGGINNPTPGNEIYTLSEAINIAGAKLTTPIKINDGEITHIVFDQNESSFRFTYKGQSFAAFYVVNSKGNVRWEVAKFDKKSNTYKSISLDEIKNINDKYGSQKNLLISIGAKNLVEDIENFEKVEYSKKDKSYNNGIIPLENTVSAEQIRLGKKYGATYTLEDFLKEYDAELAALESTIQLQQPTVPVQVQQQSIQTLPQSQKLTPEQIRQQLKEKMGSMPTISRKPGKVNKVVDPEIILERYINNNIIQKNCK